MKLEIGKFYQFRSEEDYYAEVIYCDGKAEQRVLVLLRSFDTHEWHSTDTGIYSANGSYLSDGSVDPFDLIKEIPDPSMKAYEVILQAATKALSEALYGSSADVITRVNEAVRAAKANIANVQYLKTFDTRVMTTDKDGQLCWEDSSSPKFNEHMGCTHVWVDTGFKKSWCSICNKDKPVV